MAHIKIIKGALLWLDLFLLLLIVAVWIFWIPWGVTQIVGWILLSLVTLLTLLSLIVFPIFERFLTQSQKQMRAWRIIEKLANTALLLVWPFFLLRSSLHFSEELASIVSLLWVVFIGIRGIIIYFEGHLKKRWPDETPDSADFQRPTPAIGVAGTGNKTEGK